MSNDPQLYVVLYDRRVYETGTMRNSMFIRLLFDIFVKRSRNESCPGIGDFLENFFKLAEQSFRPPMENPFRRNNQADAHEFLIFMLNNLMNPPDYLSQEFNFRGNIAFFDGYKADIEKTISCSNGHTRRRVENEFLSVSVKGRPTVFNAVVNYFNPVTFVCHCGGYHVRGRDTCNPYACDQCGEMTGAIETSRFHRVPERLVISLKIFSFDGQAVIYLFLFSFLNLKL